MSAQWECLKVKKIGDDVSGTFESNAGGMPDSDRFGGFADFSDNMNLYTGDQTKFDANWVTTDTGKIRGNPSTNVIDHTTLLNVAFDIVCNFDLWSHGIFPSDTNWTLRVKWDFTTVTNPGGAMGINLSAMISLTDLGLVSKFVNQDFISMRATLGNGVNLWRGFSGENIPINNGNVFTLAHDVQVETLFMELKRTSVTTFEMTFYSDASYSTIIEKAKGTINGNPINLRFISIGLENQGGVSGRILDGTLDDIQFFNDTEGVLDLLEGFVLHGDEDLSPVADFNPGVATKIITGSDDGNWSVGGGVSVSGGVVSGWGGSATWRRATYDLLGNDGITLDNANWTIDFEFLRSDNDANPSHSPFMIVNTTSAPYNTDPTNNLVPFPSNGVVMHYGLNVTNGHKVSLQFRNEVTGDFGTNRVSIPDSQTIPIAQNVTFYMRLMRLNTINFVLEVFANSERTSLIGTQTLTDSGLTTLADMTWINSSTNTTAGVGRVLNGTVANIQIFNGVAGEFNGGLTLNDDFSTYGAPVNPDFTDVFTDATGWTTTDSTRARVEDDQGFLFFMAVRDTSNDQIAFDLGALVNPIGDVIFTDDFSYANQGLADASWPTTDIALLDPFPNELAWNIPGGSNAEETIFHDLGINLNGNFRVRAKIDLQTITSNNSIGIVLWWYISDNEFGNRLQAQDHLGMFYSIDQDPGDQEIRAIWGENQIVGTNALDIRNSVTVPETQFIEILRTTPTSLTVNIYSDSGYTVLTDTITQVIPSGITALRYLHLSMSKTGGTNALQGILDDIEVVDNSEIVSDEDWLLSFKFTVTDLTTPTGANLVCFISLRDVDQTIGTENSSDALVLEAVRTTGGSSLLRIRAMNNQSYPSGSSTAFTTPLAIGTTWIQLIRVSPTLLEGRLYADENYSELIEKVELVISSGITNLRYLGLANLNSDNAPTGEFELTVDDFMFWNARSTTCDPVETTPSFFDDFSTYTSQGEADTAWVPQVANQRVNIVTDVLDFVTRRDGVDNRCTHDLGAGNVSNTAWTLRWKYHVDPQVLTSNVGSATLLQLQNTDVAQNSQDDMLGFGIQNNVLVAGNRFLLIGKNGGATSGLADSGNNSVSLLEADYYLELVRLDAINVRGRVFSNPDFTGLLFELNIVTNSANINHRFLIISSASDVTGWNGTLDGFIDDVQFFNNQTTTNTPWISTDEENIFVDICQENIRFQNMMIQFDEQNITLDLGTQLSDTKFVLRWSMVFSDLVIGTATNMFVGMSNEDQGSGGADLQDFIMARIQNSNSGETLSGISGINVAPSGVGTDDAQAITWETERKYFFEVVRDSATTYKVSVFDDADYTFPITISNCTVSSGVTNLRFFRIMNIDSPNPVSGELDGVFDDVKIWDGVDVADSFGARRYLQLLETNLAINGNIQPEITANLDFSLNYAVRFAENGVSQGTFLNQDNIALNNQTLDDTQGFVESVIYNSELEEKLFQVHSFGSNTIGPGNAPVRRDEMIHKWTNTFTKISRLFMGHDLLDGGTLDTDTEAVIFGTEQ